jgi:DNA-binding transcriptional LysR family regulator
MKNTISVGASSYTGEFLLPQIINDWEQQNPDLELRVDISDSSNVFEQIISGELEAGVIGMSLENHDVKADPFLSNFDELVLVCPPNHPFASVNDISINDLKGQDFVIREPGSATRMWYREMLATKNIDFDDLNIVAELGTHPAVLKAVASGSGCSFVLRKAAQDYIELGRIKEVKVRDLQPLMGSLYVIYNSRMRMSDNTRRFLNFLDMERQKLSA